MENFENVNYSKPPKKKKNILVLLFVCLLVFSLLLNLNFIFSGRGSRTTEVQEKNTVTHTISETVSVSQNCNTYENIRTLQVRVSNASVQVETQSSDRNVITIDMDAKNPQDYSIESHGGNLTLECHRLPLEQLNFGDEHIDILIEYNESLGSEFMLDQLNIQNISGEILVSGLSADSLFLQSTSGSIEAEDILAVSGVLGSTSGKLSLTDTTFRSGFQLNTVSGGLFLDGVTTNSIGLNTISGKIQCDDFITENLTSKSVSGSQTFDFNELSEATLVIESISGSIDVHFEDGTNIKNSNNFKTRSSFRFDSNATNSLQCNTNSGTITVE